MCISDSLGFKCENNVREILIILGYVYQLSAWFGDLRSYRNFLESAISYITTVNIDNTQCNTALTYEN